MSVTETLATLQHADLVRRNQAAEYEYLFKHVLTQDTVYQSLLRQDRRELHRKIAVSCEQLFAHRLEDYLALLAHHYTKAGDNVRAASYWKQYGERALQISAFPEAIQAFEHALGLLPQTFSSERVSVYAQLGDVYCRRTDYTAAQENFQNALTLAIAASDAKMAAAALSGIARIASQRGEHVQARELGQEALRWAQDANDDEAIARAQRQLGIAFNYEGKNDLAQAHLNAALALYEERRDRDGIASCLNSLGVVAREEHAYERAQKYFEQALAISEELGDRYSISIRLINLGVLAEQRGDLERAMHYQNEALKISREIGDREGAALIVSNLGSLAQTRGDLETAQREYCAALSDAMALGSFALALYIIAAIAKLEAARGNFSYSAELFGLAMHHPAGTADIPLDFQSLAQELESKLGKSEYDAAMERGQKLDLAQAVKKCVGHAPIQTTRKMEN